jgi:hypothetical protein
VRVLLASTIGVKFLFPLTSSKSVALGDFSSNLDTLANLTDCLPSGGTESSYLMLDKDIFSIEWEL